MKKIINPWCNHEGYNCFGCSPDNPIGLHMEFYEDGDYIVSTWHPEHNYQGWVDTMHGGILSTLIDEVCGWVVTRKLRAAYDKNPKQTKHHFEARWSGHLRANL